MVKTGAEKGYFSDGPQAITGVWFGNRMAGLVTFGSSLVFSPPLQFASFQYSTKVDLRTGQN
jgi:hypothetical protein